MVREALLALGVGRRSTFTGTFADQWRLKSIGGGRMRRMFLLLDVHGNGGQPVADHLWLWRTSKWDALGLNKGDAVRFRATVVKYCKRVRSEYDLRDTVYTAEDYKLGYPAEMEKVSDPKRPMLDAGQMPLLSFIG